MCMRNTKEGQTSGILNGWDRATFFMAYQYLRFMNLYPGHILPESTHPAMAHIVDTYAKMSQDPKLPEGDRGLLELTADDAMSLRGLALYLNRFRLPRTQDAIQETLMPLGVNLTEPVVVAKEKGTKLLGRSLATLSREALEYEQELVGKRWSPDIFRNHPIPGNAMRALYAVNLLSCMPAILTSVGFGAAAVLGPQTTVNEQPIDVDRIAFAAKAALTTGIAGAGGTAIATKSLNKAPPLIVGGLSAGIGGFVGYGAGQFFIKPPNMESKQVPLDEYAYMRLGISLVPTLIALSAGMHSAGQQVAEAKRLRNERDFIATHVHDLNLVVRAQKALKNVVPTRYFVLHPDSDWVKKNDVTDIRNLPIMPIHLEHASMMAFWSSVARSEYNKEINPDGIHSLIPTVEQLLSGFNDQQLNEYLTQPLREDLSPNTKTELDGIRVLARWSPTVSTMLHVSRDNDPDHIDVTTNSAEGLVLGSTGAERTVYNAWLDASRAIEEGEETSDDMHAVVDNALIVLDKNEKRLIRRARWSVFTESPHHMKLLLSMRAIYTMHTNASLGTPPETKWSALLKGCRKAPIQFSIMLLSDLLAMRELALTDFAPFFEDQNVAPQDALEPLINHLVNGVLKRMTPVSQGEKESYFKNGLRGDRKIQQSIGHFRMLEQMLMYTPYHSIFATKVEQMKKWFSYCNATYGGERWDPQSQISLNACNEPITRRALGGTVAEQLTEGFKTVIPEKLASIRETSRYEKDHLTWFVGDFCKPHVAALLEPEGIPPLVDSMKECMRDWMNVIRPMYIAIGTKKVPDRTKMQDFKDGDNIRKVIEKYLLNLESEASKQGVEAFKVVSSDWEISNQAKGIVNISIPDEIEKLKEKIKELRTSYDEYVKHLATVAIPVIVQSKT